VSYVRRVLLDTGRTVLLTWVCMLAVTHPLANFRNNLHVMSNTLVCAEVKVINSTAKLVKIALSPINGRSDHAVTTNLFLIQTPLHTYRFKN